MKTNKVFYIAFILFFETSFFSFSLSAQEDVSVEFSFNKPDTFVCEIKNKTASEMDIWFNHLKDGPFSIAYFDIIGFPKKDTVRNLRGQFKLDPPYRIRLDSGQVYTRTFHDNGIIWRFIKAEVFVKYTVRSPTPKRGSYEKTFDLEEIRKEAYRQQIQDNKEGVIVPAQLAQEDVSVEFSFKPDTAFVCEIKNKTASEMDIWFYDLEHGSLSDVRINCILSQVKLDLPYHIRLVPGQVYAKMFPDHRYWRLIKASVFVKYSVRSPTPRRGSYEKSFDLEEIRKEAYQQPIQKKEEPAQPAQKDISVEFSFKKPNEYVCEIRNMTKYQMVILFSKEECENDSDLHFDIANSADTVQNVFYSFVKEADQIRLLRLDPGQAYTVSYKEGSDRKLVKVQVYIRYSVRISDTESKSRIYRKDFDLQKIKCENQVSIE